MKYEMADETPGVSTLAVTAALGAIVLLFFLICTLSGQGKGNENDETDEKEQKKNEKKSKAQSKKHKVSVEKKEPKKAFTHPWLCTALKGHKGDVLGFDFSPNGKHVLSCAEDRSLMLYSSKDLSQKEIKSTRGNVEFDHATHVRFSPDNKAFIASLYNANTIRVFKLSKRETGGGYIIQSTADFPQKNHEDILNIGIASNGRFVMVCYRSTMIRILDLKGDDISVINTNQMTNSFGAVSPCGRFVASAGFTPDVKVYAVEFDKTGNFREVKRAFELKGHNSGVYHFAFSNDSSKMASVSKDGTWRLYDTNIEYEKQEDPKFLVSGKVPDSGPALITLAPGGRTVAVAVATSVYIYNGLDGTMDCTFKDIFSTAVAELNFDISGHFLAVAGDRGINVFHNVPGYKHTIEDLTVKRQEAHGDTLKERILKQINETKAALEALNLPEN